MRSPSLRSAFSPLRWLSAFFLLAALILAAVGLARYSRVRANFPSGMVIAGVPVGGLDRQQAAQRLLEAYTLPIELIYNDAVIHLLPAAIDFQLDLDAMLAAADLQRTQQPFWQGFWDFLWGRSSTPQEVPLRFTYSQARLRAYLEDEIARRYDQPPTPARPQTGTVNFTPGSPGSALDVENTLLMIESSLGSLRQRQAVLPLVRTAPLRPAFENLRVLLKQTVDLAGFDGLAGVYLLDLQTGQEMSLAYRQGEELSTQPDVAYTASSIIKVPIMVSVFRRMGAADDAEAIKLLNDMVTKSGNETADWLMDRVIDADRGPLMVTEDMQTLGLANTFLAGYFSAGSPLLARIETPANQRADVNTDPDPYSQTTPSDIGMLLEDIYQCAQSGGGALAAIFPGEITQAECQQMVELLKQNFLPVLLTAGIPEATPIAHKHGWVSDFNGVINTIGDAGLIYSPGGDYILVIFLNHPVQLIWESASALIAELSRAVFNYYNLAAP
ncbi:MAG: class A beta-lactamase-related serine hydrolase [Chloroflexi bacterium]|nr:class A beta-lactamase-related serine hydrolase [Chloroflexota bacterium]